MAICCLLQQYISHRAQPTFSTCALAQLSVRPHTSWFVSRCPFQSPCHSVDSALQAIRALALLAPGLLLPKSCCTLCQGNLHSQLVQPELDPADLLSTRLSPCLVIRETTRCCAYLVSPIHPSTSCMAGP